MAHRTVDAFTAKQHDPYGGANWKSKSKPEIEPSALGWSSVTGTDRSGWIHSAPKYALTRLFTVELRGLAAGCGCPVRTLCWYGCWLCTGD